jgi:hypothetical protein
MNYEQTVLAYLQHYTSFFYRQAIPVVFNYTCIRKKNVELGSKLYFYIPFLFIQALYQLQHSTTIVCQYNQ